MLHTLQSMLAPAVLERLTLLVNHVLAGERVATGRLAGHAGKVLEFAFNAWPSLLPPPPPLAWRVTPAGLLEWCGMERDAAPALTIRLAAGNPLRLAAGLLAGEPPALDIAGDAQLATDVNWLAQNLRWDIAADLERVFPPAVALGLQRLGAALAGGLRAALQGAIALQDRWRPR